MASLSELFKAGKFSLWLKFWAWKTKNFLGRMFIHFQERSSLFNYDVWRRKLKQQPLEKFNEKDKPRFGFVISENSTGGSLTVSRNAIKRVEYGKWAAWFISGECDQSDDELGNGWLSEWQDLGPLHGLQEFIKMADLDYVCFIEAGDYFRADYLSRILQCLGQNDIDMIYCDEDHYLPPLGSLMQPLLKPDPSPALLLSNNYLRHAFFHKDLIKSISTNPTTFGSLREELAFTSLQPGIKGLHIPGLFYHSSEYAQLSNRANEKRFADIRGCLESQGFRDVVVETGVNGQTHISWQVGEPLVSIIVPTHNNTLMLSKMMDSLLTKTTYRNFEVILVDNASNEDGIEELYKKIQLDGRITLIKQTETFNYSAYNNIGAASARGEVLVFLNNDVEIIEPEWLSELVMWADRPEVGVVGARLMYPNGRIQHAGVIVGLVGSAGHVFIGERPEIETAFGSPMWYRNYLAVTGACMAVRREVFEELGGFDEAYHLTFSDITLCLKAIEKGYQVVYNPFACLIHHEGRTRGDHIPDGDIRLMAKELSKWVEDGDPYFNIMLSHLIATPALKRNFEESPVERLKMISALAEININERGVKS